MKIRKRSQVDLFSPLSQFIGFSALYFLAVYLYLINYFNSPYLDSPAINNLGLGLNDYSIGFLAFVTFFVFWLTGYLVGSKKVSRKKIRYSIEKGRGLSIVLFYIIYLALWILFLVLFYYHPYTRLGVVEGVSRSTLTTGFYGKAFFLLISLLLAFYTVFTLHVMEKFPWSPRDFLDEGKRITRLNLAVAKKKMSFSLAYLILILNTGILVGSLLLLEGKARALSPIIILVISYHYKIRKVSLPFFLVFCLALMLSVFYLEASLYGGQANIDRLFDSMFGLTYGRMFDTLYNLSMLIHHSTHSPNFSFFYGETFVADILDDIGIDFGTGARDYLMHQVYSYPEGITFGVPISKPGEFYLNFGILGLIFGGYVSGYVSRFLYFFLIEGSLLGQVSIPCYIVLSQIFANPTGYLFQKLIVNLVSAGALILFGLLFLGLYKFRTFKFIKSDVN